MRGIAPPATIGILGGGQLGRMLALSARSMGYRVVVLDPSADCVAAPVADRVIAASFDDVAAAEELAKLCDVVTLEIEQIAPDALRAASRHAPLRPAESVVIMVQDRARQKRWLSEYSIPVGPYAMIDSAADLESARATLGRELFVKACQGGFDGRSQLRLSGHEDAAEALRSLGSRACVAEAGLDLELELSVLVARSPSGEVVVYPPAVNHHENQVLAWSSLPGDLSAPVVQEGERIARMIAEGLALEGILAVEMFLLRDGRLLVNELAPRPHNSYHASELACPTSQFEQLVRAACDLPLGAVSPARPSAIVNIFGDAWLNGKTPNFAAALAVPGVRLFLYGKAGARAGRKMGHLGASGATAAQALATVRDAASRL